MPRLPHSPRSSTSAKSRLHPAEGKQPAKARKSTKALPQLSFLEKHRYLKILLSLLFTILMFLMAIDPGLFVV
jgi:hypothetical protein